MNYKLYTLDGQFIKEVDVRPLNFTGIIEYDDASKAWFFEDNIHRLDGPAYEGPDGTKCWYIGGEHHRLDGPAVVYPNGLKLWYINGKRHRLDGPAIEYADGSKEWWIDNELVEKEQHMLLVNVMKLKGLI